MNTAWKWICFFGRYKLSISYVHSPAYVEYLEFVPENIPLSGTLNGPIPLFNQYPCKQLLLLPLNTVRIMINAFHDTCFQWLLKSTDAGGGFGDKLHSAYIKRQEGGSFCHDRHCTNLYIQRKSVASESNKREKEKHKVIRLRSFKEITWLLEINLTQNRYILSQFCASSNLKRQADGWRDKCRLGQPIVFFLSWEKWQDNKLEVCMSVSCGRREKDARIDSGHCTIFIYTPLLTWGGQYGQRNMEVLTLLWWWWHNLRRRAVWQVMN